MVEGLLPDGSQDVVAAEKRGGKLFIGNVRKDVEKDEIHDCFKDFGKVLSIWIAKKPPGFAFVTFDDADAAKQAIEKLDGSSQSFVEQSNGRGLRVEASIYAEKKNERGDGGSRQFRRDDSRRRRAYRRDESRGRRRGGDRDYDDRGRGGYRGRGDYGRGGYDDRGRSNGDGRGRRDSRDRYRSRRDSRGRR